MTLLFLFFRAKYLEDCALQRRSSEDDKILEAKTDAPQITLWAGMCQGVETGHFDQIFLDDKEKDCMKNIPL